MKETIETQVCNKCGLQKPLSEYYFRKDRNIYRRDCKTCEKKRTKAYREANREKLLENKKTYYKANREKMRVASKVWRKANPEKRRASHAKRRAAKLQATPAWADLQEIQNFYEACPPGHHIDHIFPLVSDKMCGLHVRCNLQYLPAKENIRKKNNVTLEQQLNG